MFLYQKRPFIVTLHKDDSAYLGVIHIYKANDKKFKVEKTCNEVKMLFCMLKSRRGIKRVIHT